MTTRVEYDAAFAGERGNEYPEIDAFETRMGFALERAKLEEAARVLACPVKANPPNWQHGRVIYAAVRKYLAENSGAARTLLDIGTAKGFSALCMTWAAIDSGLDDFQIVSCDVIDPQKRERRNTVAEVDVLKTLKEILEPWPEARGIKFVKKTGADWLKQDRYRVHFAFVDGKHSLEAVSEEIRLLGARQQPGDIVIFDDVQIPGVGKAVAGLSAYSVEHIVAKPDRRYAVAMRA